MCDDEYEFGLTLKPYIVPILNLVPDLHEIQLPSSGFDLLAELCISEMALVYIYDYPFFQNLVCLHNHQNLSHR